MNKKYDLPDKNGYFGQFGAYFVPDQLIPIVKNLADTYYRLKKDRQFINNLHYLYQYYAGRPSDLYFAKNLTEYIGGAKIYLKREDLNHTGAHKINNCVGQGLVAKSMKKKKLIAETGAGQHGVATATVAAYFGMKCDIYMGIRDIKAQAPNVYRMKILGANVIAVSQGQGTLKDAVDAALNAYIKETGSYYLLGSVVGPHPYPVMVRDFQKVVGKEIRQQILKTEGRLPDSIIACIGGGSNAIGAFFDFIPYDSVNLIGVEPAGKGINSQKHGLSLYKGTPGLIHGYKTLVLQTKKGRIKKSYSAASGLDYPGVGPELSYLKSTGRLQLGQITDRQAVNAFVLLSKTEGIISALESAHAVAYTVLYAKNRPRNEIIVVNLSGRGDKDVENVYINYLK